MDEDDVGEKVTKNHVLVNQFHGNIHSKALGCGKIKAVFRDVKWCINATWGLKKGLKAENIIISMKKMACDAYMHHLQDKYNQA